jgi:7-dehydrocholesterol reductase
MALSLAKENLITRTVVPLLLVTLCPAFAMLMWYTNAHLDGSFLLLGQTILTDGLYQVLHDAWFVRFWGSSTAWAMIAVFAVLQLAMMKLLPGKPFTGTITPMGNLPVYKDNGLASYIITFALFLGASVGLDGSALV